MFVEGTLGPPHDVSHRSGMNRQNRRAQNHSQRVVSVGVSWIVQEDGELKSEGQPFLFKESENYDEPNHRHQDARCLGYFA